MATRGTTVPWIGIGAPPIFEGIGRGATLSIHDRWIRNVRYLMAGVDARQQRLAARASAT
jgi:hypothetical protein